MTNDCKFYPFLESFKDPGLPEETGRGVRLNAYGLSIQLGKLWQSSLHKSVWMDEMGYHLSRGFFVRNSVMFGCQKLNWWRKEIRVADYNSAVFWRKVILVPKVILRYGGLKVFFLWTQKKAPRKARRWPHLKS